MNQILLLLLKEARLNEKSQPQPIDYLKLYQLSAEHQIIPLIYNQIYFFPDFPEDLKSRWKRDALRMNVIQTMKTEKFLRLYSKFLENDLKVVVVKGLICRSLYPQPDNRPSNDEDLYVEQKDFAKAKEILVQEGLIIVEESDDVTTFLDRSSGVSIELHTALFSKSSKAYGNYQSFFDHAFDDLTIHHIQGVDVYSLSHDLHLLFLITHFVKHFLHGGVGIRQIVDIVMYSETYGDQIHWQELYQKLDQLNTLNLMENVFALAHDYLAFDFTKIELPEDFQKDNCDCQELLEDIMDAGIFGKSSAERLHSSTMTLNATATGKTSVLKSVFPKAADISGRYPYLKKYPYLVPAAWIDRLFHYLTNKRDGNTQKTIEMGNQRIELLKKYKVIK